jgi:hypothetical protein
LSVTQEMTTMSDDNRFDAGRRKMLARLGLALSGAYVAPAVMQLGKARASSFSRPSARVRRQAPRRAVAPAPPPEIVVATVDPAGIDLIAAQGYQLLSRSALSLLGVELARFSVPPSRKRVRRSLAFFPKRFSTSTTSTVRANLPAGPTAAPPST